MGRMFAADKAPSAGSQADHWSDRELYEHMWHETLREITMDLRPNAGWTHHIDFLSGGSDEDNEP